ncbi:MAG: TRAPP subunit trs31 [Chrysothrix sp. TS-e1954]|nr:MAG: TRAPP subunit trs31 [Chrysothrix sp. TS-e1954]
MSTSLPASRPISQNAPLQQHPQQGTLPTRPQSVSARQLSTKKNIYDRNLNKTRTAELSRASFAYLIGEMVTYAQRRVTGIADLEKRLNNQGYPLGLKLLDLLLYRSPTPFSSTSSAANNLRPTRVLPLLQFISTTLWKHLFGRPADALERSQDNKDEYMITDNEPVVNTYISVPKEMSQLNCAAYAAGIVEGVCDGCGFYARVSAHTVGEEDSGAGAKEGSQMWPGKTVFLIKFTEEVMEREEILSRGK